MTFKELFLPEKIKNVRIYAQRIAGIAIQENHLAVAVTYAKSSTSIIEKLLYAQLPPNATDEQVADLIKKVMHKAQPYDHVKIAIPSSFIIFKELEVPFTSPEKIRMVLDYEIEAMLPFSLDEAIIDFVITHQNIKDNTSQILVAAIRYQDLDSILSLYKKAGIDPTVATIDIISLYNIYQQIPDYTKIKQASAIIDIGATITRVSFIINGQLRLTRNIPRGIVSISQQIQQDTNLDSEEVMKKLLSFGIKPSGDALFDKSTQQHIINFFNDIQFSLNSFSLKLNYYQGVTKILLGGFAYQLNGLTKFCSDFLQIPTENFDVQKLLSNTHIKEKLKSQPSHWMPYTIALGTAIPSLHYDDFNLRRKAFAVNQSSLIKKQLIAACILILFTILTIGVKEYFQITKLKKFALAIEKKEENNLLSIFSKKDRPKNPKLQLLVQKTEQLIKDKEELWAAFGKKSIKPLEVLLELTSILDKRHYAFSLEEIIFNEKEAGNPIIEIDGYFESPRGTGFHYTDFLELEKRFNSSALLSPTEPITAIPAADKGVRFSVKLKKKDNV